MIFTRTLHGSHPALAPILASKDFRRFLIAQGTSSIGDWVATVALISLVWGRTHSSGAVGGLIALRLLPALLVGPAAGALADRADRRRLMVVCDLGRAGVAVAIPFVALGSVFVLAFLMEVLSLLFGPPRDASVPRLVPHRSVGAANALVTGAAYGTLPLGAAGYAGLAALAGLGSFRALPLHALPLFTDAASFLVSAALLARIQTPLTQTRAGTADRVPSELGERRLGSGGFGELRDNVVLRWLVPAVVLGTVGGGALYGLGVGYVHSALGAGDVAFGGLMALYGVGMGLGLWIAARVRPRSRPRAFLAGLVGAGVVLLVMGALPWLVLALTASFAMGAAFTMAFVSAMTITHEHVPDELRGRAFGVLHLVVRLGFVLGGVVGAGIALVAGRAFAAPGAGERVALVTGGVLLVAGAWALRRSPPLSSSVPHVGRRASGSLPVRSGARPHENRPVLVAATTKHQGQRPDGGGDGGVAEVEDDQRPGGTRRKLASLVREGGVIVETHGAGCAAHSGAACVVVVADAQGALHVFQADSELLESGSTCVCSSYR